MSFLLAYSLVHRQPNTSTPPATAKMETAYKPTNCLKSNWRMCRWTNARSRTRRYRFRMSRSCARKAIATTLGPKTLVTVIAARLCNTWRRIMQAGMVKRTKFRPSLDWRVSASVARSVIRRCTLRSRITSTGWRQWSCLNLANNNNFIQGFINSNWIVLLRPINRARCEFFELFAQPRKSIS